MAIPCGGKTITILHLPFWDFGLDLWYTPGPYLKSTPLQEHVYSKHAPGAVFISYMILERIWLENFFRLLVVHHKSRPKVSKKLYTLHGRATKLIERMRNPGRQAFSDGIRNVFIVIQWTETHSSLNHTENMPYPVWKSRRTGFHILSNNPRLTELFFFFFFFVTQFTTTLDTSNWYHSIAMGLISPYIPK